MILTLYLPNSHAKSSGVLCSLLLSVGSPWCCSNNRICNHRNKIISICKYSYLINDTDNTCNHRNRLIMLRNRGNRLVTACNHRNRPIDMCNHRNNSNRHNIINVTIIDIIQPHGNVHCSWYQMIPD